MAKTIMILGTCSNAGKSVVTAGICRILKQDGYKVAPFKAQNMALNSFITKDGMEMGRAQVMQAEACQIEPDTLKNKYFPLWFLQRFGNTARQEKYNCCSFLQ